ncbi:MAG: 2-isopropylmalate synthase [Firmicutes bacterium]|nr:2-isopropylmalate synthase [Bacillota bacterium]
MTYYRSQDWWTSPYNVDHVRATAIPPRIQIHDATLRDGEQTPGVVFTPEEKVRIAQILDGLGVQRIEAGMPAVSEADAAAMKAIADLGLKSQIFSFARAMEKDILLAKECGAHGVVIEVPIGKPKLDYQFRWTWRDVAKRSADAVQAAKEAGLYAVLFPYDTTRAEWDDLENLLGTVLEQTRPDSVGVIDTVGCVLPAAMATLVRRVKNFTGLPVEVHSHNDLGLALANSLSAMEAGAEVIHTCINGLGERTGNTSLFEVFVALRTMYGIDFGADLSQLKSLAEEVASLSRVPIMGNAPVVGDHIFTRESGIGIEMLKEAPLAMFSLNPAFVGQEAKIVLGKKSGLNSIRVKLAELGVEATEEQEREILRQVKEYGVANKSTVSRDVFVSLVQEVLG